MKFNYDKESKLFSFTQEVNNDNITTFSVFDDGNSDYLQKWVFLQIYKPSRKFQLPTFDKESLLTANLTYDEK